MFEYVASDLCFVLCRGPVSWNERPMVVRQDSGLDWLQPAPDFGKRPVAFSSTEEFCRYREKAEVKGTM